jgi:hypothetical protein
MPTLAESIRTCHGISSKVHSKLLLSLCFVILEPTVSPPLSRLGLRQFPIPSFLTVQGTWGADRVNPVRIAVGKARNLQDKIDYLKQ